MTAQCWCYLCAGRIVTRNTFVKHGRKKKPDEPSRPPLLGLLSMPELPAAGLWEEKVVSDDEDSDADPLGLEEEGKNVGKGKLSSSEIVLLFLDWMSAHKITDSAAKALWALLCILLPVDVKMPGFVHIKSILTKAEGRYCKRYDICPNDCVAYYDSQHLATPYRHAHRFSCPVCGQSRYVTDPKDGNLRPAKTVFFFPLAPYIRSLYSRPELVPHLLHDGDAVPNGHVQRSRGFHAKIRDNPHMNCDHRNLGLIGTTDGVPFFDDQRRGAWPFVFRCANLPDGLATQMSNCHLSMLSANEFWELDNQAGVLRRRIRGPKSLKPHLTIIVDDLLHAYNQGIYSYQLTSYHVN